MKYSNLKSILFLLIIAVLSRCASMPKGPKIVSLDNLEARTFKFLKQNNSGKEVTKKTITSVIKGAMYSTSGYRKQYKSYGGGTGSSRYYDVQGIDIEQQPNTLTLTYVSGTYYPQSRSYALNKSKAAFNYNIQDKGDFYKVTFDAPKKIETPRLNLFGLEVDSHQLLTDDVMKTNIYKVFSKINPSLDYTINVSNEINVDFDDKSVYANFKRILGEYKYSGTEVKTYDIEKDNIFLLENKEKRIPLKLTVYPYRDGSKVTYEFPFHYSLTSDGKTSYNQDSVNQLIAKIESVAKD